MMDDKKIMVYPEVGSPEFWLEMLSEIDPQPTKIITPDECWQEKKDG